MKRVMPALQFVEVHFAIDEPAICLAGPNLELYCFRRR